MCFLTLSLLGVIGTGTTLASIGASLGASTTATVAGVSAASAVGLGAVASELIGIGASVGGGIVSTIGGIQQQQAMAAQAEYQAKVAEENAKLAAQSAEANELQGNQKRLALMNRMQQMQGQMRADFAGRGVVLGSGTPNDYEADLADSYEMDKKNLNYDIASKTWQYRVQESSNRQQAELYRAQAKGARSLIPGVVAGGLLSTAGELANAGMASYSLYSGLGIGDALGTAAKAPERFDYLKEGLKGAWGTKAAGNQYMISGAMGQKLTGNSVDLLKKGKSYNTFGFGAARMMA